MVLRLIATDECNCDFRINALAAVASQVGACIENQPIDAGGRVLRKRPVAPIPR